MANHTTTTYEVQNMIQAPPDVRAVFLLDDGTRDYVPVFAFAVAKVFEQSFNEKGEAQTGRKETRQEVVGLAIHPDPEDEPTYAHDMICEDVSNFKGYVRGRPQSAK